MLSSSSCILPQLIKKKISITHSYEAAIKFDYTIIAITFTIFFTVSLITFRTRS